MKISPSTPNTRVPTIPSQILALDRINELLSYHHSGALRIQPTYGEENIPIHCDVDMVSTDESMKGLTGKNFLFSGDRIEAAKFIQKNADRYSNFFVFTLPGVSLVFVYGIPSSILIRDLKQVLSKTSDNVGGTLRFRETSHFFAEFGLRKHQFDKIENFGNPLPHNTSKETPFGSRDPFPYQIISKEKPPK